MDAKPRHALLHRIEYLIDKLIPYCLLLLVGIVVSELFFSDIAEHHSVLLSSLDWIVIVVFVVDLVFKYARIQNTPQFLKKYWIEVIAVFPSFLIIRLFEEFAILTRLDEVLLVSQDSLEVTERTAIRANRVAYFHKFIRPLARIPRFFKAFHFYEHPRHRRFKNL